MKYIFLIFFLFLTACSHCNGKTFWGVGTYTDKDYSISSGFPIGEVGIK